MRYNKLKAFTLAELMILLLTLSILLAAMAPVFTRRYTNFSNDEVWSYITGDDNYNAYYDAINKSLTAQAFIGITPANKVDVDLATSDNLGPVYSKLVIRASDRLSSGTPQHQMQFRYGDSAAGTLVGSLFAGNGNMLVGGIYNGILDDGSRVSIGNTAFGVNSLSALTEGDYNTAIAKNALSGVTSGSYNTAIGINSGKNIYTGKNNTLIGNSSNAADSSNDNTIVGNYSGRSGSYNTAVGNNSMQNVTGSYNTAAGNYAMKNKSSGDGNTAVGYNAMANITTGKFNTALGDNSCLSVTSGSYKTCIGSYSGGPLPNDSSQYKPSSGLFTGDHERVFIGTRPVQNVGGTQKPGAVLEVHNIKGRNSNSMPIKNAGNASVVINGNLIVRGQTYLESVLFRPINADSMATQTGVPKGLVAFRIAPFKFKGYTINAFSGFDGADRTASSFDECYGCRQHAYQDIRPNCICTAVSSGKCPNTQFAPGSNYGVSTSYDWVSKTNNYNGTSDVARCDANSQDNNSPSSGASYYTDGSFGCQVKLDRSPRQNGSGGNYGAKGTDLPYAHMKGMGNCCPDLKASDIRLKNVGEKFTAGLDEIKKLKVYNYTFKNDPNKIPQVGVIAQDLKQVFPNSVVKGDDGYYKIRWDEMFYAAMNSIKTLNLKVKNIAAKISKDKERIAELKKNNAELNNRLDKLVDELEQIEDNK